MKCAVRHLIMLLFCCAHSPTWGQTADRCTFPIVQESVAAWHVPSAQDDEPPPVKCSCGGDFKCGKRQWGYCECPSGRCHCSCTKVQQDPNALARDVLSVVVKEEVTVQDLKAGADKYSVLLDKLLSGKSSEGKYRLIYEGRRIDFSFAVETVSLLSKARADLGQMQPR